MSQDSSVSLSVVIGVLHEVTAFMNGHNYMQLTTYTDNTVRTDYDVTEGSPEETSWIVSNRGFIWALYYLRSGDYVGVLPKASFFDIIDSLHCIYNIYIGSYEN